MLTAGKAKNHARQKRAQLKYALTPTPIDDEYIEINLSILYERSRNPLKNLIFSWFVIRDIPIWEHKVYHQKPLLCRGDSPIMKLRAWAKQFFASA